METHDHTEYDPYGRSRKAGGPSLAKTVTGLLVLTVGVGVAIWVLSVVGQALGGKDPLPVVERIARSVGEGSALEELYGAADSRALAVFSGYLIAVFLLSIAAGIAKALITAGAQIMNPDCKKFLAGLKKEFGKGKAAS